METIAWEDRDGARWIQLEGELDHAACLDLKDRFTEAVVAGEGDVVVVLDGVSFLSSAGIGMLVQARKDLEDRGRALRITGLQPAIRRLFESLRLLDVFEEL